jgi:hypothetical protein
MSDVQSAVVSIGPNAAAETSLRERRTRWFEVGLVLSVACGGYLVRILYLLANGPGAAEPISNARWTVGIAQEIASLLLLGYVLSRRGQRLSNLGLRWSLRDAGVGLLMAGVSYAAYVVGSLLVQIVHHGVYGSDSKGPGGADFLAHASVALIPLSFLNPFFEE